MSTTFSAAIKICPPVDPSGKIAATPFEIDVTNAFAALLLVPVFTLSGSGTTVLPLGALPSVGARLFALMLDVAGNPAAIALTWTYVDSTTGGIKELTAAGQAPGVALVSSAAPANGIVAVSVTHSGNATVRYVAIG